ncbi:MAG: CotH kinase family protein [Flavobacterium sp.]
MKSLYTHFYILFFIVIATPVSGQNIVINEILTSNTISNTDEDGTHQDWIELFNSGATTVNLSGYGLSDDSAVLNKWVFPNVSVGPGQYLLIWASDKNRAIAGSPLHTNFKISSSGEVISLSNSSGIVVNSVPAAVIPSDISYGRLPNGTGSFVFFENSTPNAVNSGIGYAEVLNPPVFSQNSGFLTTGFSLTLTSTNSGATILYTLDGSEPNANNLGGTTYSYKNQYPHHPGQATGPLLQKSFQTLQYSTPISIVDRTSQPNKISTISSTYDYTPPYIPSGPIFKGTTIRAKVIKTGALSSKVITKNYFISPQGNNRFTLPVLSLSIDENKLYDYTDGIYVAGIDFDNWRLAYPTLEPTRQYGNFERSGIENERIANLNYFVNGVEVVNQKIGIRVHGAYSRVYPSKSLTLYARSDYGTEAMGYKFFSDEPYTSYERLVLRNGGSDFYATMFRDALNHELVKSLRLETEACQQNIIFINGEYWGILGLREKYDNNYFKQVYNIPSDEIDVLENQGSVEEGDNIDYNAMYNYFENNSLVSDTNYNYIKTQLDPENFTDYFTTNIFFYNRDWPGNNIIYWRKKTATYLPNAPYGHDGRWRWAIHDMDSTFKDAFYNSLADATATNGSSAPNPAWSTLLLRKLLENNSFKIDFINRFADLMNTSFLSSRIIATIDSMKAVLSPEMNDQYFRWKAPVDNTDWNYFINKEKEFANTRPAFQRDHIRAKFGISSNINATLNVSDPSHGFIKMNTINIADGTPGITGNPYPWTGIYFHNIPVKLKAIPKPGFIFSHWSGASTSTNIEITLTLTASFSVIAHFIPDGSVENSVPIYFWMMDSALPNNVPLETLNSTYELGTDGLIQYQSCLVGYPFTASHTNWRKASMERRNSPTAINYRTEANDNLPYDANVMRGLQIKQPFQSGGLENTMLFNFSTDGYKNIKFSFAAMNELTGVNAIAVDYAVNSGTPVWITTGLTSTSLPITGVFQLFQIDFSSITSANDNADFKVRLRFTGTNLTVDDGNRVTFNNFAVDGVQLPIVLSVSYNSPNVFIKNTSITNLNPTVSGGTVLSYSVLPSLPAGLSLDTSTGVISGTPTMISTTATYVVTANNSGGNTTANVIITVNDAAPSSLSYTSPNVFIKDVSITNLNPLVSGGTVISYSIVPDLPAGLSLNSSTGVISGTPTVISPTENYIITATNSGGSTTFTIVITVEDPLSVNNNNVDNIIIYPNPFSYAVNVIGVATNVSYKIYTIDGKLIKKGTILTSGIELSELPNGVYLLQLLLDDKMEIKKIIKK